ncbi:MAG: kelch repeat-containing protein [Prolixibacteraceae bacterium]
MILQNLSVHKWSVRALKVGIACSILVAFYSCNNDDDEDLIGNWVNVADFEGVTRSEAVAVSFGDNAYVIAGYDGEDRLKDTWEYNGSWTSRAPMPAAAAARNGAVGFGANGKVYVTTGYDGDNELRDLWEYDPVANSWTEKAALPAEAEARYGAVAFSIGNKGYVGTGFGNKSYLNDFWEYNPGTDIWTKKATVSKKRRDAAAFVIDGKGYICTGISNGAYVDEFESYDPAQDKWTPLRDISDATDDAFDDDYDIVRTNAVAFVVGGKGYIATGGRSTGGTDVWEYNPGTDLWIEKTGFEGASRQDAVALVVNDVAYIGTGRSSSYYFDDVWRFEPNAEYDEDN